MFLRILVSLILMSSSFALAELTAAEEEYKKSLQKAVDLAEEDNRIAASTRDSFSKALESYMKSFGASASSTGSDISTKASNALTGARASVAKWFTPGGPEAEIAIEDAAIKIQKQNIAAMNAAQKKADTAALEASNATDKALKTSAESFKISMKSLGADAAVVKDAAYLKSKEAAVNAWIGARGIQGDMSTLSRSFDDLNEAKILIERNLDRSIMANYMQSKMTKLLSSDALCKVVATNSCKNDGKNTSMLKASDLKSVFPNNPESNYSSGSASSAGAIKTTK